MSDLSTMIKQAVGSGYRIERELGGGGMSRVFLAEEVALGRRVVIKVLPPEMAATVNADRFRREIQLAAQLQHPAIVPLLSAGSSPDLLWYVMPFVDGESLREKIARVGPLPMDESIRAWRDLLEALEYAHGRSVVHRDIKPDNIMMSGRHAVAMDFGVAKAVSAATSSGLAAATQVGLAIGTPAYMAPEQAAGDTNIDGRTDLYAAGLVMYEMLAGRGPFEARTPSALMAAHMATPPAPITSLRADVAPELAELVMQCLAKAPEERPANAAAVLHQLDALASGLTASRTPTASVAPARGRRRPLLLVGVLAVVAIGAAAGGIFWTKRQEAIAAMAVGLADSARLQVAFMPVTHEAGDSVLAENLSSAQFALLATDRRLRPFGDQRMLGFVRDAGIEQTPPARDSILLVVRDFGMHTYLLRSIARTGDGYLLTTEGRATIGDSSLFREQVTANSASELPQAVEALSERTLRSLRSAFGNVKRPDPTGRFLGTTAEAARLWVEASSLFDGRDYLAAAAKLRMAVRADSQFAAGWYSLSTALGNFGINAGERFQALSNAYRYRDRMRSAWARDYLVASYLREVGDPARAIEASQRALQVADESFQGLVRNTIGLAYNELGQFDLAVRMFEQGSKEEGNAPGIATGNLGVALLASGRVAAAESLSAHLDSTVGRKHSASLGMRTSLAYALKRPDSVLAIAGKRLDAANSPSLELTGLVALRNGLALSGRIDSLGVVDRRRRVLFAENRNVGAVAISAAQEATWRAELLGDQSAATRVLDEGLRSVRWDTLPALDRSYGNVIAARAALGETAVARQLADQWERTIPPELTKVTAAPIAAARGEVELAEGNGRSALSQFVKGIQPVCPECAWVNYARAYDAIGMADSTIFWYERYLGSTATRLAAAHTRHLARAYKRLGELYEEKGDNARAIQRYTDFVTLWKNADAQLQPAVRSAEAAIARLQAKTR